MKKSANEWITISDLMSGLMIVFMFIAISFMLEVEKDKSKMKEIVITYTKYKKELNKDLHKEFDKDLKKWNAEITRDNSVIFKSPNVLFESGKSTIKPRFKEILNDFFPRYLKILTSDKYKNEIEELRIEGHTSNVWKSAKSKEEIYLNNMKLSQERANSVLTYCYLIDNPIVIKNRPWLEKHLRANGMAFAKLKYKDKNKKEIDYVRSRRVEFKIKLKTEERLYKILEVGK